jgi:hypothetical protein
MIARDLWQRFETLHAVTYFGRETQDATAAFGATGFWMGYFGLRAGPMGAVGSAVVDATFFNFAPTFVRRCVPAVWSVAAPSSFVAARAAAAATTLRRVAPAVSVVAETVNSDLATVVAAGVAAGRTLFAANRELDLPDDPVARLWQLCTTLREHRGDTHVAALTAAGVDGLEAHVLMALDTGRDPTDLQMARGWNGADWAAAVERLRDRGLVADDARLTEHGRELRHDVESVTDALALRPWSAIGDGGVTRVLDVLTAPARDVAASGTLRYPNPIGLPPLAQRRPVARQTVSETGPANWAL